jgi:hypothetical protein
MRMRRVVLRLGLGRFRRNDSCAGSLRSILVRIPVEEADKLSAHLPRS